MYRNLYRHINRHICLLTHRIPYRQVNHTGHHHCHHISVNILLIFIITVLINCHWSVGVEMDKEIEGENAISRVVLCQTDWFAQMTNCWSCLNTTWITSYDFITSCDHDPHHHHHHHHSHHNPPRLHYYPGTGRSWLTHKITSSFWRTTQAQISKFSSNIKW